MIDCLFINPGTVKGIYQDLSDFYICVEPPTWALLLAQTCRVDGFSVAILDANAERLNEKQAVERIKVLDPRLICFTIYGQNVNAGVVGMASGVSLSNYIKRSGVTAPIAFVGTYVQALPKKTLKEESSIDIVLTNEGVIALKNLLKTDLSLQSLRTVKGIGYREIYSDDGRPYQTPWPTLNAPEQIVQNLDTELPGYAWDLLPYKDKPFDLYRSPMWHAEYDESKRSPYAAVQSSLGCPMKCEFCVINSINRNDNAEIGVAGNYSKIRYWSPEFIIKEFDKLYQMGVRTIKITDELFLLNKNYYIPLCKALKERGYGKDLRLWVYSRVDTVSNPETLQLVKDAGVKYVALGIESSSKTVRLEVSKGKFQDVDIKKVVNQIHDAGIEVMANYIFGLPTDTMEAMRETLDLSKELCTAGWNGYAAMNLPGSQLYYDAVKNGIELPKNYLGYSFHSYDTICNRTEKLTAAEILKFRDEAYTEYHSHQPFLDRINGLYGPVAVENIKKMNKVKLKRKILGD